MTSDEPPSAPAISRLEARYLDALPPLYYGLGGLWILGGWLPLVLFLGTARGLGEAFGEGVGDALFQAFSGSWPVGCASAHRAMVWCAEAHPTRTLRVTTESSLSLCRPVHRPHRQVSVTPSSHPVVS